MFIAYFSWVLHRLERGLLATWLVSLALGKGFLFVLF